ncbi:patatin-like phospholipase family protein [Ascidiimonas sp. W6]|uniref:patatin-like phospholipase family protein n=1 Tax=Ascidiimonas meishanensis TaxID=3128903 RepID=UPI0030EC5960
MKIYSYYMIFLFLALLVISCDPKLEPVIQKPAIETTTPKTIVLAIDGGGIKGIIPAIFVKAIEDSLNNTQSYKLYDLIGGTSTGGIISVALTSPNMVVQNGKYPFTGSAVVDIYKKNGKKIFVAQCSPFNPVCRSEYAAYVAHGTGSHSHDGIEPYMQSLLGATTKLSDTKKFIAGLNGRVKQMFTTSYTVNSTGSVVKNPQLGTDYGPYLFNWYDAEKATKDNYYVWEAGRGTSAAPTYFPIARAGGNANGHSPAAERWVVDGGMMSNDPSLWGVTEALRTGLAKKLEDIVVISLGTGLYPGGAGIGVNNNTGFGAPAFGNWGTAPWLGERLYNLEGKKNDRGTMVEIILDAVQLVTDKQMNMLRAGGLTYHHLEPTLTAGQSQMDNIDPANITSLENTANAYIKSGEGKKIMNEIVTLLRNN